MEKGESTLLAAGSHRAADDAQSRHHRHARQAADLREDRIARAVARRRVAEALRRHEIRRQVTDDRDCESTDCAVARTLWRCPAMGSDVARTLSRCVRNGDRRTAQPKSTPSSRIPTRRHSRTRSLRMERSGRMLDRVERMFGVARENVTNREYQALEREWQPKLAAAADAILFNRGPVRADRGRVRVAGGIESRARSDSAGRRACTSTSCGGAQSSNRLRRRGCRKSTRSSRPGSRSSARRCWPTRTPGRCSSGRRIWQDFLPR